MSDKFAMPTPPPGTHWFLTPGREPDLQLRSDRAHVGPFKHRRRPVLSSRRVYPLTVDLSVLASKMLADFQPSPTRKQQRDLRRANRAERLALVIEARRNVNGNR